MDAWNSCPFLELLANTEMANRKCVLCHIMQHSNSVCCMRHPESFKNFSPSHKLANNPREKRSFERAEKQE